MEIKETAEKNVKFARASFREAKRGANFVKTNLSSLNMGNDKKETADGAEREQGEPILPEDFMNLKVKRKWNQLSAQKKAKYYAKNEPRYTGLRREHVTNGKSDRAGEQAINSSIQELSGKAASEGAKTAGTAATEGATAGATMGVSIAARTAKKTADMFKDSLKANSMAVEQTAHDLQGKIEGIRSANAGKENIGQTAAYIGATALIALMGVLQMAVSMFLPVIAVIVAVVTVISVVVSVVSAVITLILGGAASAGISGAEQIVEIALTQDGITDGTKYWEYTMGTGFVDGNATPWCACFVSWCANECDLIEAGVFPKTGAVAEYKNYFARKGLYKEKEEYTPKTGDLIVFNPSHIGIVQFVEGGRVVTIEGNTSDAVHSRSYPLDSSYIVGYCTPEYPGTAAIIIPQGMGTVHTYMGWHTVTSKTSLQYQLREKSGENYDEEGFAKIGDRYVIACTSTFGSVGDYIDFYREDGAVIHAVIGDIKNQNDPGCNEYGHLNGKCVVEYVVSRSWYPFHVNPGTSGCHPEWNSRIEKAVNLGKNYFD